MNRISGRFYSQALPQLDHAYLKKLGHLSDIRDFILGCGLSFSCAFFNVLNDR